MLCSVIRVRVVFQTDLKRFVCCRNRQLSVCYRDVVVRCYVCFSGHDRDFCFCRDRSGILSNFGSLRGILDVVRMASYQSVNRDCCQLDLAACVFLAGCLSREAYCLRVYRKRSVFNSNLIIPRYNSFTFRYFISINACDYVGLSSGVGDRAVGCHYDVESDIIMYRSTCVFYCISVVCQCASVVCLAVAAGSNRQRDNIIDSYNVLRCIGLDGKFLCSSVKCCTLCCNITMYNLAFHLCRRNCHFRPDLRVNGLIICNLRRCAKEIMMNCIFSLIQVKVNFQNGASVTGYSCSKNIAFIALRELVCSVRSTLICVSYTDSTVCLCSTGICRTQVYILSICTVCILEIILYGVFNIVSFPDREQILIMLFLIRSYMSRVYCIAAYSGCVLFSGPDKEVSCRAALSLRPALEGVTCADLGFKYFDSLIDLQNVISLIILRVIAVKGPLAIVLTSVVAVPGNMRWRCFFFCLVNSQKLNCVGIGIITVIYDLCVGFLNSKGLTRQNGLAAGIIRVCIAIPCADYPMVEHVTFRCSCSRAGVDIGILDVGGTIRRGVGSARHFIAFNILCINNIVDHVDAIRAGKHFTPLGVEVELIGDPVTGLSVPSRKIGVACPAGRHIPRAVPRSAVAVLRLRVGRSCVHVVRSGNSRAVQLRTVSPGLAISCIPSQELVSVACTCRSTDRTVISDTEGQRLAGRSPIQIGIIDRGKSGVQEDTVLDLAPLGIDRDAVDRHRRERVLTGAGLVHVPAFEHIAGLGRRLIIVVAADIRAVGDGFAGIQLLAAGSLIRGVAVVGIHTVHEVDHVCITVVEIRHDVGAGAGVLILRHIGHTLISRRVLLVCCGSVRPEWNNLCQIIGLPAHRPGQQAGGGDGLRAAAEIRIRYRGRCGLSLQRLDINPVQPVVILIAVTGGQVVAILIRQIAQHLLIHRSNDALDGGSAAGRILLCGCAGHQDPADQFDLIISEHRVGWPLIADIRAVFSGDGIIIVFVTTIRHRRRRKRCTRNSAQRTTPVATEVRRIVSRI